MVGPPRAGVGGSSKERTNRSAPFGRRFPPESTVHHIKLISDLVMAASQFVNVASGPPHNLLVLFLYMVNAGADLEVRDARGAAFLPLYK